MCCWGYFFHELIFTLFPACLNVLFYFLLVLLSKISHEKAFIILLPVREKDWLVYEAWFGFSGSSVHIFTACVCIHDQCTGRLSMCICPQYRCSCCWPPMFICAHCIPGCQRVQATGEPSLGTASTARTGSIQPQLNGSRPPQTPTRPSLMGPPATPASRLPRKTLGPSRSLTEASVDTELSEGAGCTQGEDNKDLYHF